MDAFPAVPRLALTATADANTRADIITQLGLPDDGLIIAGFDRPNIRYVIRHRENPVRQLTTLMAEQPGPGIVYAPTRKKVEDLAEKLAAATGRTVLPYHAGLDPQVRGANQAAFVASEDMVIVATVAFGMGIDKPDVRFRRPCRCAQVDRELLSGNRPRGPRWRCRAWRCCCGRRMTLPVPASGLSEVEPQRRDSERVRIDAHGRAGRNRRLPPRAAAAAFRRRPAADLRQLRQLP